MSSSRRSSLDDWNTCSGVNPEVWRVRINTCAFITPIVLNNNTRYFQLLQNLFRFYNTCFNRVIRWNVYNFDYLLCLCWNQMNFREINNSTRTIAIELLTFERLKGIVIICWQLRMKCLRRPLILFCFEATQFNWNYINCHVCFFFSRYIKKLSQNCWSVICSIDLLALSRGKMK